MSALSDLIVRCLAAKGMSAAELARESGLSEQQISQWINDSRPMLHFPAPATMTALAKGLGVDDDIVVFACMETIGMNTRHGKVDEHTALLLATVKDIPRNEAPRVLRMLRAYLRGN